MQSTERMMLSLNDVWLQKSQDIYENWNFGNIMRSIKYRITQQFKVDQAVTEDELEEKSHFITTKLAWLERVHFCCLFLGCKLPVAVLKALNDRQLPIERHNNISNWVTNVGYCLIPKQWCHSTGLREPGNRSIGRRTDFYKIVWHRTRNDSSKNHKCWLLRS